MMRFFNLCCKGSSIISSSNNSVLPSQSWKTSGIDPDSASPTIRTTNLQSQGVLPLWGQMLVVNGAQAESNSNDRLTLRPAAVSRQIVSATAVSQSKGKSRRGRFWLIAGSVTISVYLPLYQNPKRQMPYSGVSILAYPALIVSKIAYSESGDTAHDKKDSFR